MKFPAWFGARYPTIHHLERFAEDLGAGVGRAEIPFAMFFPSVLGVPVILIPAGLGLLEECWELAHELGHLVQHTGPRGKLLFEKDETAANLWAARALIPQSAVMRYQNASRDAFIGALSKHFEDIPLVDCDARRLAAKIADFRLQALLREAS